MIGPGAVSHVIHVCNATICTPVSLLILPAIGVLILAIAKWRRSLAHKYLYCVTFKQYKEQDIFQST